MSVWSRAREVMVVQHATFLEYRAEILLWMLCNSMPFILMGVWMEAARAVPSGMTPVDYARYFLTLFVVRQLTVVWVIFDFEEEVVQGRLSSRLLQPLDPVWLHVSAHIAERFSRLPFVLLLVGLFFLIYPDAWWVPSLPQLAWFTLACVLGLVLRFLIQHTLALVCFWTERAYALEELFYLCYAFLSGMIAPLALFPEQFRELVLYTPFPWLIYYPIALLTGQPVDPWEGLWNCLFWIGAFWAINRLVWRAGLKRYSAMGA